MNIEIEKNSKEPLPNSSRRIWPVFFFFGLITICLASGYYFFALRLAEMAREREQTGVLIENLQDKLEQNQRQLKEVQLLLEVVTHKQAKNPTKGELLILAKLTETSLAIADVNTALFLLDKIKEVNEEQHDGILKGILERDCERIRLFNNEPFFQIGIRLNGLLVKLEQMPDLGEISDKIELSNTESGEKKTCCLAALAALKQLFIVEKINYKTLLASERNFWYMNSVLSLNKAEVAWVKKDFQRYRTILQGLKEALKEHYGLHPWGISVLEELDSLLAVKFPEVPSLEIVKVLQNKEAI